MTPAEYLRRQRVVELEERFLSYVDEGDGAPVVLVHGIPTWGYLWSGVLPTLAERARVLVPDLLGFGMSDRADRFDRSIARQAEAIVSWLDRLGIARATFVGHDIGGGVALRLATLFAARVESLVILNGVAYDSWPIEAMLQVGHPAVERKLSASALLKLLKVALRKGFAETPPNGLLDELLLPYATEVGKRSLIRNASALNTNLTTEVTALVPRITAPTLVIWGEDDGFQDVAYGHRLASDIPGARLVRLPGASHFVMWDRREDVERLLVEHLSRRPSR